MVRRATVCSAEMASSYTDPLLKVRQIRQYAPDKVPDDVLQRLLEVIRWTGSSQNKQPWHFIVITDPEALRRISVLRPNINWVASAPLAIALVFDGGSTPSDAYEEERETERILIAAHLVSVAPGT